MNPEWLQIASAMTDEDLTFIENTDEENLSEIILTAIKTKFTEKMKVVANSWYQIGLPERIRAERINEILIAFESLCSNIAKTEEKSLNDLILFKETKIKEINQLMSNLGNNLEEIIIDQPLLLLCKNLHFKCENLKQEKEKRLCEWEKLISLNVDHSNILGIKPRCFATENEIPTTQDIEMLRQYTQQLNGTITAQKKKLEYYKKTIMKLLHDLELSPTNEFENKILYDEIILSENNLNQVKIWYSSLEERAETISVHRNSLFKKLIELYNRLEINENERINSKVCANDLRSSTIKLLENEIERLEVIKKANMGKFIEKLRPEIVERWEKCYIGNEYRVYFNDFFKETEYNEELLEIHEREVERLKLFYEENQEILTKLEAYYADWERLVELQEKANDPKRLNNRGGTLLKEEAMRKKLHRTLPKLENEITELCRKWSDAHGGEQFKIYEENVEEFFRRLWDELNKKKENEKKSRQVTSAAAKGRNAAPSSATRKTPVKRLAAVNTNSPLVGSSNKMRKLNIDLSPKAAEKKKTNTRSKLEFKKTATTTTTAVGNENNALKAKTNPSDTFICEDEFQATITQVTVRRNYFNDDRNRLKRRSQSCNDLRVYALTPQKSQNTTISSRNGTPATPGLQRSRTALSFNKHFL